MPANAPPLQPIARRVTDAPLRLRRPANVPPANMPPENTPSAQLPPAAVQPLAKTPPTGCSPDGPNFASAPVSSPLPPRQPLSELPLLSRPAREVVLHQRDDGENASCGATCLPPRTANRASSCPFTPQLIPSTLPSLSSRSHRPIRASCCYLHLTSHYDLPACSFSRPFRPIVILIAGQQRRRATTTNTSSSSSSIRESRSSSSPQRPKWTLCSGGCERTSAPGARDWPPTHGGSSARPMATTSRNSHRPPSLEVWYRSGRYAVRWSRRSRRAHGRVSQPGQPLPATCSNRSPSPSPKRVRRP